MLLIMKQLDTTAQRQYRKDFEAYRIELENGFSLSIVRGEGTYSGADTYEVAVINRAGDISYRHTGGDDVLGFQTEDDIKAIAERISKEPVPISPAELREACSYIVEYCKD